MFGRRGLHLCLITDRPQHPVIAPVAAELSTRHRVRVIDPDSGGLQAALREEVRDPADLYLLRSHTQASMDMARHVDRHGTLINNWAAADACRDRVAIAARIEGACLPWPETWRAADLNAWATRGGLGILLRHPVVVKSRWTRRGDLVRRVDTVAQLKAVAGEWPAEPVIVQRYIPNDGWDRKVYVIDGEIFGVYRPSPLRDGEPEARMAIKVPAEWASLARAVGIAFGLRVYGLDLVLSATTPTIVDVNSFPGFRGVAGAGEALIAMVDRLADEPSAPA
jgi:ribosomal protein S6--L-glutamate ligase